MACACAYVYAYATIKNQAYSKAVLTVFSSFLFITFHILAVLFIISEETFSIICSLELSIRFWF